ncbi:MAG: AMP-dependent synthetase [Halobacteriovorax sp.]|nr:AMP-dependent synthetase [Halobacteriovorax sp.]|tara:strand:- start:19681 stop:20901 length:1221 start_codon:yes stop_codon:yes gene_type:complete
MFYSLEEIVRKASRNSPFYKELYKNINPDDFRLEDLPIIDQSNFWEANHFNNNSLLTEDIVDGVVFKSGGTTGNPKFSVYSKDEWQTFTKLFGEGMDKKCLEKGDRVGNLFYSGDLYASFLFINKSIENSQTPVLQFPMTGGMKLEEIIKTVEEYSINVLAGVPTTFTCMAELLLNKGKTLNLEKVLYGGEALYPEQREILKKVFPNAQLLSIGYASVDGGHLGYIDKDCGPGEHKVFDGSIMEIINDSGEVITNEGEVGKLVYTNLARTLMPIIRYPVGDLAKWVGNNKFLLLGRSDEGARIGPVTVNRDDLVEVFRNLKVFSEISNFQMIITRENARDTLEVKYTASKELSNLQEGFYKERKMYLEAVQDNHINHIKFTCVHEDELEHNERTGKLKLVIDRRHQ